MLHKFLGWLLLVAAVAGVGAHLGTGGESIAEAWYSVSPNSLVGLQSLVEKRLDPNPEEPTIYFDYVLPVLELPIWLCLAILAAVIGIIFLITAAVGGNRQRRRFMG
jgi:hypothetical protein